MEVACCGLIPIKVGNREARGGDTGPEYAECCNSDTSRQGVGSRLRSGEPWLQPRTQSGSLFPGGRPRQRRCHRLGGSMCEATAARAHTHTHHITHIHTHTHRHTLIHSFTHTHTHTHTPSPSLTPPPSQVSLTGLRRTDDHSAESHGSGTLTRMMDCCKVTLTLTQP